MAIHLYREIISLRDNTNDMERGYKFEQIIREIQPWDIKPPVVMSLPSEQIDGIFTWKGQTYLIESKAKEYPITPGSHDWEDFELKIRRRKNTVIGLFCSLFPVNSAVYDRATDLNKEGHFVIVLDGSFWDEIYAQQLPIDNVLEYMNLHGRVKFLSKPPEIKRIKDWRYDKDLISKKVFDLCRKNSATFLRRHRAPFHQDLYVRRDVDNQIEAYSKDILPSSLKKEKESPKQICLVRDFSGSGKTTLSIEVSGNNNKYFGTGITANEQDIDEKCISFFNSLGHKYGLLELISCNKPIVFVIDSLDEANSNLSKKREILSIFKFIDEELNKAAESYGLLVYPVLFLFTIREDYWRDWESILEGRRRNDINKRISTFSYNEFPKAIEKYSNCYGYTILNEISIETKRVLSTPVNLLIFSETHKYQGDIEIREIWEGNVIDSYFVRKKDDIHKRSIYGFTSNIFFNLISLFAYQIVKSKNIFLKRNDIDNILNDYFKVLTPYSDEIINALISEHIIIRDTENLNYFRFRHSRFVEFLLAYHIVATIEKENNLYDLDHFAQISFDSGIVMMFRVHDDIRYIGKSKFPRILSQIEDYYSKSNFFMSKKLLGLRAMLADNNKTRDEDIALVLKNINSKDSDLISDAYYVIVAKSNSQPQETVLNLFVAAFNGCCSNIQNRYKLIAKLEHHNLLVHEKVLDCMLFSNIPKDWEVYLGLLLDNDELLEEFRELWSQLDADSKFKRIKEKACHEDWRQVDKLMKSIMENVKYIKGDVEI